MLFFHKKKYNRMYQTIGEDISRVVAQVESTKSDEIRDEPAWGEYVLNQGLLIIIQEGKR